MSVGGAPKLCIVQPNRPSTSETFLRAHAERLPARVTVIHGGGVPTIGDRPVKSQAIVARACRKAVRIALRRDWKFEVRSTYIKAFRKIRPDAVLAEYGIAGVAVMDACRLRGIPFVVHFHGYDASTYAVLEDFAGPYQDLFRLASAIVVVSRPMGQKLVAMGAPAAKVFINPYGVDCKSFHGADPGSSPPVFLAVGRLCEKKAPHLTLLAFAQVYQACPEARLRMIGFGPLEGICRDLINGLRLDNAVTMLGACPPGVVQEEMRRARCFVQHSITALNGDAEGTPVAILEAGASSLPLVSTRHEGIPDVVVEGETGFLVDEGDVASMATHMLRLANEPDLAAQLGRAARRRIEESFSMDKSIGRLWSIIEASISDSKSADGS
jgi:glycosyltransferase involved in cell wall biosynthesis